jgi:murein L,D-transpeptidase YafK
MKADGQYALLKTFPMCRWSGQLGPKKREGDRQVPEGFYTITPGQMNPNSAYYLSFNVGYPNAFDKAWDRTGGTIMVHGICSSAGCYSMTDAQIADIYALARDAFNGGQREIQLQSYPFRMTAENLAKHRLDPNIEFWTQLKNGADHFEVTKTEPSVLVCGKHYVFGAHAEGEVSARAPCPPLRRDPDVETAVAERHAKDMEAVAALIAKGVKPIRLVYDDGGQNPVFAGKYDTSRPDALVAAPREIVLDNSGKPLPEVIKVAAAAEPRAAAGAQPVREPAGDAPVKMAVNAPAAATPAVETPLSIVGGVADSSKSLMTNLFKTAAAETPPAVQVFEPEQPIPADVPLPPKRSASLDVPVRMAALPSTAKNATPPDDSSARQ